MSTASGGIYLRCFSWSNDEEEQQFFNKGWNFGVLELACFTSSPYKGLQEHYNKFVVSLSIFRTIFLKVFQKWIVHESFMFNVCHDLMPCCLGFPQYKGMTFSVQCLTSSFGHWENWNPKTNKEFLMFWLGSKW